MNNLIPYNLFEMARYNIDNYIKKMSEVIELILDYDFKDLIEEIYGENLYEYFKVKSKPELNKAYYKGPIIEVLKREREYDENSNIIFLDIMDVNHFKPVGRNDSVYYLAIDNYNFEKMFVLEEFSMMNNFGIDTSRVVEIQPGSSSKRIFDNFYEVLKKDMIRHA
jgi:hypothetical protein